MSTNKYAGLPDIDTAPDVYETEDVFPSRDSKADTSDDESTLHSRSHLRGKNNEPHSKQDELDQTSLVPTDQATRRFRRAEKKQRRPRIQYTYPLSPTASDTGRSSPDPECSQQHAVPPLDAANPLAQRLSRLKAELAALEADAARPDADDAESLIRDIVGAKVRLERIGKDREGRSRLVSAVLQEGGTEEGANAEVGEGELKAESDGKSAEGDNARDIVAKHPADASTSVRDVAEMDRRVGELEKIIGASTAAIDEASPLPPPLLPLLTRLSAQLAVLTQPRHIDNISRRLKLLLSDLDRLSASASQQQQQQQQQRKPSAQGQSPSPPSQSQSQAQTQAHAQPLLPHTDALAPTLTRLAPLLPHIPLLLVRLRTLSALHANAALFQSTLETLEAEQRRVRAGLGELEDAVSAVEESVKGNGNVVRGNVRALEERVGDVVKRVGRLEQAGRVDEVSRGANEESGEELESVEKEELESVGEVEVEGMGEKEDD